MCSLGFNRHEGFESNGYRGSLDYFEGNCTIDVANFRFGFAKVMTKHIREPFMLMLVMAQLLAIRVLWID